MEHDESELEPDPLPEPEIENGRSSGMSRDPPTASTDSTMMSLNDSRGLLLTLLTAKQKGSLSQHN